LVDDEPTIVSLLSASLRFVGFEEVRTAATGAEALALRGLDRPLRLELLDGDAPVVLGDEDRQRQVVTNLLGNALTHTPAGTPVIVRVGADGDRALLEVVDHGPGLAPEHAERIFERFYHADPARARDHARSPAAGSGLGLSIVAALVAAHGGEVRHRPTPGGGASPPARGLSAAWRDRGGEGPARCAVSIV
jgi:two-component system OmpR family sensor kinase